MVGDDPAFPAASHAVVCFDPQPVLRGDALTLGDRCAPKGLPTGLVSTGAKGWVWGPMHSERPVLCCSASGARLPEGFPHETRTSA